MWGVRAASASRRRVCCSSRLISLLPLPLSASHRGRDGLQRFKSSSHPVWFQYYAVCPFLLASFVHHPIRRKASRHVMGCGLGWNPGWQQCSRLEEVEFASLWPGPRLPWDLSWWWTSQRWFWRAGERRILLLVWWRSTECKPRAKIRDVVLWG